VVDVHALFALAGRFDHRAVRIDDRFLEEVDWLLAPHLRASLVEDVLQGADVIDVEPTAEVTCRRRVRDATGVDGPIKTKPLYEKLRCSDAAARDCPRSLGHVVVDVRRRELWPIRSVAIHSPQSLLDPSLAIREPLSYRGVHSKTSGQVSRRIGCSRTPSLTWPSGWGIA
jgi:hypothetical protein